mgnify:CR=1 FL=1|tara:strand:+ start:54 stop:1007 length:954 start_codon:yes stop_codon:yes gene_type:complete
MKILITGAAGFIGMHLTKKLLKLGYEVDGIDSLSKISNLQIKKIRLSELSKLNNFKFFDFDIKEINKNKSLGKYDCVVHLAAHAGVRNSFKLSNEYLFNNLIGHNEILKFCVRQSSKLFYASSSSVYGEHDNKISKEFDTTDEPSSIYGVTKKSCEMLSKNYFDIEGLPQLGFRFFTVYGEYGRPDMAYWIFTECIKHNKEITVFNDGNMLRDFTYIDDVILAIELAIKNFNESDNIILNIGRGKQRKVKDLIKIIEKKLDKSALIKSLPKNIQDVSATSSDNSRANELFGYDPKFDLEEGMENFIDWHDHLDIKFP